MPNLKLPIPENDDTRQKRERRSNKRTKRKIEDLARADVPDRSCLTCERWWQADEEWGECRDTLVVMERVNPEVVPPRGIDKGTVVSRWPNPHGTTFTCIEPLWDYAKAFGKAQLLRTHRTFPACERYTQKGERAAQRTGPSLKDRVQGRAA